MSSNVAIQRLRVVIIAAGFGGLSAAKALAKAPLDVAVIDRYNCHMFAIALPGCDPGTIPASSLHRG